MYTKQNGHNWLAIIVEVCIISFAFLLLSSCFGGFSDWTYQLPNNYAIIHNNTESIELSKEGDLSELVIPRHVVEFSYNELYVGIKRFPVKGGYETSIDVDHLDYSKLEYYLINTKKDIVFGPFDSEEYQHQCDDLGIRGMTDWIKTRPVPEGVEWF